MTADSERSPDRVIKGWRRGGGRADKRDGGGGAVHQQADRCQVGNYMP